MARLRCLVRRLALSGRACPILPLSLCASVVDCAFLEVTRTAEWALKVVDAKGAIGEPLAEFVEKADWDSKAQTLQQAVAGMQLQFKRVDLNVLAAAHLTSLQEIMAGGEATSTEIGKEICTQSLAKAMSAYDAVLIESQGGQQKENWVSVKQSQELTFAQLKKIADKTLLALDPQAVENKIEALHQASCPN